MEALSCASIPRSSLVAKLTETGYMSSVLATCTKEAKICFPTTSSAVISSSACLRFDSQQDQEAGDGDGAVVVATASSPAAAAGLSKTKSRPNADVIAAYSVYATSKDRKDGSSSTPPSKKKAAAATGATKHEGKKELSATSSAQHSQQEQDESPSLRDTFGGSPEISVAAA